MHWDWLTDLCLRIWKDMGRKLLKTMQTITTFWNPLANPMGTRRGPPLVRGPQFENRWVLHNQREHTCISLFFCNSRTSCLQCLRFIYSLPRIVVIFVLLSRIKLFFCSIDWTSYDRELFAGMERTGAGICSTTGPFFILMVLTTMHWQSLTEAAGHLLLLCFLSVCMRI